MPEGDASAAVGSVLQKIFNKNGDAQNERENNARRRHRRKEEGRCAHQLLVGGTEYACYIGGFTSLVGGLQYISYVEYGSVDAKDKYRLTGMSSCGGTPTGMAIRYMTARLKKLPAANKLLIVSTDGRSADGADALQKIIKEAKKDGVTVVGAGIGASRSAVEKEFGDAFLDVSDMEKMPQLLAGIVKRHLLR